MLAIYHTNHHLELILLYTCIKECRYSKFHVFINRTFHSQLQKKEEVLLLIQEMFYDSYEFQMGRKLS